MKLKRYVNGAWVVVDKELKQLTTATDSAASPISITAPLAEPFDNYRVYGSSSGVGDETGNLYNYRNRDPDNGYADNNYIKSNGSLASNSAFEVSEYVPIEENTTYYLYWRIDTSSVPGYAFYNENKVRVGGGTYGERPGAYITTPSSARFLRFSVRKNTIHTPTIGLYMSEPDKPAPYGYQIPLVTTSGAQSTTTPVYIGDSKLGAEEYVDFGAQKVYKRTANLFDYMARDPDKGFVAGARLTENGSLNTGTASANWCVSEYISIEGGEAYTWKWTTVETPAQNDASIAFYDANKTFLNGIAYRKRGVIPATAPQDASYIRVSFLANEGTTLRDCVLVEDSTAPASYIPYLQPTDPPVPLPAISTYRGENTLSSTETLGECSVTGRIKPIET
jgi:hypothetical protein